MNMKNIKIDIKKEMKVVKKEITEITFDGITTELSTLVDIMNNLNAIGTNIFAGAIIHDAKLQKKLKELDVIKISHKGHNHKGKNFLKFVDEINWSIDKYKAKQKVSNQS